MRLANRFYVLATLLPLLLLALFPELRLPAQKLDIPWLNVGGDLWFFPNNTRRIATDEVLDRAPNDVGKQIWAIAHYTFLPRLKHFERDSKGDYRPAGKMLALAQLAKEHPQNALILVQALIQRPGGDGRVAGPWEDSWHGFRQDSSRIPVNSYTPGESALILQLARLGQKLEPQNTFFDWAVARSLFEIHRDAEAIQVLIAASQKTDYDMHWREFWPITVAIYQHDGQPLLPEEKVFSLSSTLLHHLSWMSHVTKLALWNAMQKEEAGDVKGALQIEAALARLNMLRTKRGVSTVEQRGSAEDLQLVWDAPEEMRWARVFYVNRPQKKWDEKRIEGISHSAKQFIKYCNVHGHSALAQETAAFETKLADFWNRFDTKRSRDSFINYMAGTSLTWVGLCWFVASLAVWQLFTALGWLILATSLSLHCPSSDVEIPQVGPRTVFYPLIIGGAISILTIAQGALFVSQAWADHSSMSSGATDAINCGYISMAIPPSLSLLAIGGAMIRIRNASLASSANGTFETKSYRIAPEPSPLFVRFWQIQASLWHWTLLVVAILCASLLTFNWVTWFASSFTDPETTYFDAPLYTPGVVTLMCVSISLCFLGWSARNNFGLPESQRGLIFAGFWALRRAGAWMIPFSLWLIIITLWCAIPARQALDNQWNQYLRSENTDG